MPTAQTPTTGLVLDGVAFTWPDGSEVFHDVSAAFGPGLTGLIGRNGSGKSTLLEIIAGVRRPDHGHIRRPGPLAYVPQDLPLDTTRSLADVLGLSAAREALHRIESGAGTDEDFVTLDDRWDIEEQAVATLHQLGLAELAPDTEALDRELGTVSGGEATLLGIAGGLLGRPAVLLLDEPTNNLDSGSRARLRAALHTFRGIALVVSHDRELLDEVDTIAELRDGELRMFVGNYSDHLAAVEGEQQSAQAAVRQARSDLARQRRELVETQTALDRRRRYANSMTARNRYPKIVANTRKSQAQVSAAKLRGNQSEEVQRARRALDEAQQRIREDREIRISLPDTIAHPGQRILDMALPQDPENRLTIVGPERIALVGRNGAGKTTLLRAIAAADPAVPWRLLPQRLEILDESQSVYGNLAAVAGDRGDEWVRAQLARFLFRGTAADAPTAGLSGGERVRLALAMTLLAQPAPQLLMLDEPTNNLDIDGLEHVAEALGGYGGALIVASHDRPFLHELEPTRWFELDEKGLHEVEAP